MEHMQIDAGYTVSALIGLIVWFTRLESKTARNEKDIDEIKKKHDSLESKLIDDLTEVKLALARIEGKMEIKEE